MLIATETGRPTIFLSGNLNKIDVYSTKYKLVDSTATGFTKTSKSRVVSRSHGSSWARDLSTSILATDLTFWAAKVKTSTGVYMEYRSRN
jgi:hypothetical protein